MVNGLLGSASSKVRYKLTCSCSVGKRSRIIKGISVRNSPTPSEYGLSFFSVSSDKPAFVNNRISQLSVVIAGKVYSE